MIANQEACCHFLVFFSGVEDNDKPFNSWDSLSFLDFFLQMEKMTTSWEAANFLSSLGFFLRCRKQRQTCQLVVVF